MIQIRLKVKKVMEPGVGRNFPTENILTRKAFGISTLPPWQVHVYLQISERITSTEGNS